MITTTTETIPNKAVKDIIGIVQDAQNLGADAVINVRLTTSTIIGGASEILAYGTAVKLS